MRLSNMRPRANVLALLLASLAAACDSHSVTATTEGPSGTGQTSLRVVNAYTTPVDILIDGTVTVSSLAAGTIATTTPSPGNHTLALRPTGSVSSFSQSITTTSGATSTIAVVRASSGSLSTAALDDTNSVVPAGATKVRVLHLAPNAGTLQVYRTQPDFPTPVSWQFPFTYQANPTSLSAPFYQSTVGTWDVRVWQTPADPSGWSTAPVRVTLPLLSGEKKTILILDAPGGGVRTEVL
jgi:Domain of unknown function (DUF4397)